MRKINSKFVIVFTLIFLTINSNAQDRNIIWAHGLGGDQTHWEHYENLFNNERQINSVNEQYTSGSGINTATVSLRVNINNNLNTSQENDSRNLGIGHSLGGVVLRNLDMTTSGTSNQRIGGLITIDSPNYGAPIVNSIQNGDVTSAAQNGCDKLSKGPVAQILPMPLNIIGNFFNDDICNAFINNDLIEPFGNNTTANNLLPNSAILSDINNFPSTMPRISIWGEENSPVHWRTLGSFMNYGDSDYALADHVNIARGIYNGFFIYNTSMAIVCAVGGFWNPFCWGMTGVYTYRAVQWKKGRN
jgi:pimeloyl-ACP methyl ester carboxylesterase